MTSSPERGWEAVDHAEERLEERAQARQRTDARRRRRRSAMVWLARIALPLLGAAAVLATVRQAEWMVAAAAIVPALAAGVTARPSIAEAALWVLIVLAAEVVLVVGVGYGLAGLEPR